MQYHAFALCLGFSSIVLSSFKHWLRLLLLFTTFLRYPTISRKFTMASYIYYYNVLPIHKNSIKAQSSVSTIIQSWLHFASVCSFYFSIEFVGTLYHCVVRALGQVFRDDWTDIVDWLYDGSVFVQILRLFLPTYVSSCYKAQVCFSCNVRLYMLLQWGLLRCFCGIFSGWLLLSFSVMFCLTRIQNNLLWLWALSDGLVWFVGSLSILF